MTTAKTTTHTDEHLPTRCMVDDDMKEVAYGPCMQCGYQMNRPVRLFPHEQPLPILNCPRCHAGMGVPIMEQWQRQAGMPLVTPPETVLDTSTVLPAGSGESERN